MSSDLLSIRKVLEVLVEECETDKSFRGYDAHIEEYNRTVQELQSLGHFQELKSIQTVFGGNRAMGGIGVSSAEMAKHHEVKLAAKKLLALVKSLTMPQQVEQDSQVVLERIFSRFGKVARQLRSRHSSRPTLGVDDEYDVQDLLHALLQLYFDDIRAEEWTPSYAGKSARMDFLLKKEKIVIEVKKTRENLSEKEIGDQLIVDIDRYKEHSDCRVLMCFVYDPELRVGNPQGLEKDLTQSRDDIEVRAYVYPK